MNGWFLSKGSLLGAGYRSQRTQRTTKDTM